MIVVVIVVVIAVVLVVDLSVLVVLIIVVVVLSSVRQEPTRWCISLPVTSATSGLGNAVREA